MMAEYIDDTFSVLVEHVNLAYCGAFVNNFKETKTEHHSAKRKDDSSSFRSVLKNTCGKQSNS